MGEFGAIFTISAIDSTALSMRPTHNPEVVSSNLTPATNLRFTGRAQAPGLFVFGVTSPAESGCLLLANPQTTLDSRTEGRQFPSAGSGQADLTPATNWGFTGA